MTPWEYMQRANGIFIVEKFEDGSVTAVKLNDLLRDGNKARRVEFRNGASLLAQAGAWGQSLSFEAGALIDVATSDTVSFHMANVVPRPSTELAEDYERALAILFSPSGLRGSFGI